MAGKFVKVLWLIFHFSGLRFIWEKINPPGDQSIYTRPIYKRPPATFLLWVIGLYVAFFGIASQRYENRVDKIENRANAIFPQLSTSVYKKALGRIARVQNMGCPYKPRILDPSSVFRSLFSKDTEYTEMVELLRETIEDWKDSLDGVKLIGANLEGANLEGAELEGANLEGAELWEAKLRGANLYRAKLRGAYLEGAKLRETDVREADLRDAHLVIADLRGADLWGADLRGANLRKAKNLTIRQISKVKTLYGAKLDPGLKELIEKDYPHLLENPLD